MMSDHFINIAAYRFVSLVDSTLPEMQMALKQRAATLELKGTILLSTEGINLCLVGTQESIDAFKIYLESWDEFKRLIYKESSSDQQPFKRMLVRIKKEIITMGHDNIQPNKTTAPYISPEQLKSWYDDNQDMIIIDTRNDYEVQLGTFDNAIALDIDCFSDLPERIEQLPEDYKTKPVVTFCTGGIRCEKAAQYMLDNGFNEVYQLEGGILNYFEQCGGAHYNGDCFVFDTRIALNTKLEETQAK